MMTKTFGLPALHAQNSSQQGVWQGAECDSRAVIAHFVVTLIGHWLAEISTEMHLKIF